MQSLYYCSRCDQRYENEQIGSENEEYLAHALFADDTAFSTSTGLKQQQSIENLVKKTCEETPNRKQFFSYVNYSFTIPHSPCLPLQNT